LTHDDDVYSSKQLINQKADLNFSLISVCQNYAPGTYLPRANRFDAFIICGDNGTSVSMYCQSGFVYNALTTTCEHGNRWSR